MHSLAMITNPPKALQKEKKTHIHHEGMSSPRKTKTKHSEEATPFFLPPFLFPTFTEKLTTKRATFS